MSEVIPEGSLDVSDDPWYMCELCKDAICLGLKVKP